MTEKELALRRLKEGLVEIAKFESSPGAGDSPEFERWRSRMSASLDTLFGPGHDYSSQFSRLVFQEPKVVPSWGGGTWDTSDLRTFGDDLVIAKGILQDAIEQAEMVASPGVAAEGKRGYPSFGQRPADHQPVNLTVNVNQTQVTNVSVAQYLAQLKHLPISAEERQQAEGHLQLLSDEFKGQHRWEKMGPALSALAAIGKGVYEKVALPLLAELAKKAAGL